MQLIPVTRRDWPTDATGSLIGDYVRQARIARQLPLSTVAQAVGISVPYLSNIERGVKHPPIALWQAIGAAVGVDMERLKLAYCDEAARRAVEEWNAS